MWPYQAKELVNYITFPKSKVRHSYSSSYLETLAKAEKLKSHGPIGQNRLERLYSSFGLEMPHDPPGGAGRHSRVEGCLDDFTWPVATQTHMSGTKWMDFTHEMAHCFAVYVPPRKISHKPCEKYEVRHTDLEEICIVYLLFKEQVQMFTLAPSINISILLWNKNYSVMQQQ